MSYDQPQWGQGPYQANPGQTGPGYQWPPNGWGGASGPYGWAGPGTGPGAGPGPGPGAGRRIDALDVLEGMLQDGFSLSNLTRIARASGSNFWIGAAIGAGLVVLANRHDVRDAVSKVFGGAAPDAAPEPTAPAPATPPEA